MRHATGMAGVAVFVALAAMIREALHAAAIPWEPPLREVAWLCWTAAAAAFGAWGARRGVLGGAAAAWVAIVVAVPWSWSAVEILAGPEYGCAGSGFPTGLSAMVGMGSGAGAALLASRLRPNEGTD